MSEILFVVALGLGTVFTGLVIIVALCKVMSYFVGLGTTDSPETATVAVAPQAISEIPDKPKLIAAVSAVVAEELGTDITNIRIHSIKRI